MIDYIVLANNIYAYNPTKVIEKKQLFEMALRQIDVIYERIQGAMQDMWWQVLHTPPEAPGYRRRLELEKQMDAIGSMLVDEEKLLTGCKAKVKLLKRK